MKARISNLHKTEAAWAALADFKPEAGELVIYDKDDKHSYPRLKIGDGEHKLADLPFVLEAIVEALWQEYQKSASFDAGRV